ncbi:hypothetical protein F5051DRAFT_425331 [Lentinula edodes]|nr:hypothetical protein F5051DRAFT_425331 [Lentinula edodes]
MAMYESSQRFVFFRSCSYTVMSPINCTSRNGTIGSGIFRGSVNLVGCILEVIEVVSRRREREMVGPQVEEFLPHGISVVRFPVVSIGGSRQQLTPPILLQSSDLRFSAIAVFFSNVRWYRLTAPAISYLNGIVTYLEVLLDLYRSNSLNVTESELWLLRLQWRMESYQETFDSRIVNYASYAKTTVLAYEILINLGREVDLVWSANFRWSNVIYYMNRYPVVVFQVWELCYKTSTLQYVHFISISYCDALYQFFWYTSFIPTRAAITASFALRVYAIMDGRLFFVVILTALGVAIVGLDVLTLSWYLIPVCWIQWQGVQSSCSQSSDKLSTIATFISLACFDVLTTILVTVRMIKTIRWGGKLKGLESSRIAAYILRSGVLYFGAVTVPQLIAIALYFQGSSTILNNFMLVISSIMVSRFLLDLREINETQVNGETTVQQRSLLKLFFPLVAEVLFRDFMSDNGDDLCSCKDNTLVSEQPNESKHCSTEASEGKEV